jgi:hypothetical protein
MDRTAMIKVSSYIAAAADKFMPQVDHPILCIARVLSSL